MRKETYVCDICGKDLGTDLTQFSVSFWSNRKADAAGGMEDIHTGADLCPKHLIQLLNTIDQCIRVEDGKLVLGTIEDANRHRSSGALANLLDGFLKKRKHKGA
jgi:hypothetical protein